MHDVQWQRYLGIDSSMSPLIPPYLDFTSM